MEIKKVYLNKNKSWMVIVFIMLYSFLLNLEGLYHWAQQKSISKTSIVLIKLAEAFNFLGEESGINGFRAILKNEFTDLKNVQIYSLVNSKENHQQRNLAEINTNKGEEFSLIPTFIEKNNFKKEPDEESESEKAEKVLLIGDSILKSGLQMHMQNLIIKSNQKAEVEVKSQSGTGLSRPEIFDWVNYVNSLQEDYEAIYIFLGTNDAQNILNDKKIMTFGSDSWKKEYAKKIINIIENSCKKSQKVFWVGTLKMKSENFDRKMSLLNSLAKKTIESSSSCAKYVNVESWLTAKSKYADHLNIDKKSVRVRMEDGIHLSFKGAQIFSKKLLETVTSRYD
jgi:hypothetical protein